MLIKQDNICRTYTNSTSLATHGHRPQDAYVDPDEPQVVGNLRHSGCRIGRSSASVLGDHTRNGCALHLLTSTAVAS